MPKKITINGTLIEENDFYKVVKPDNQAYGKICVISKFKDEDGSETLWFPKSYKIVGKAILVDKDELKLYSNLLNWQIHGKGTHRCHTIEIDGWKTKKVKGKEETSITFYDENGRKFVRCLDEEGNLYKKSKAVKQTKQVQEEDTITV